MHPTLISMNGVGLHTWGLMITLAFAAASLLAGARARRVGVDPDKLVPVYLLAPFLGLAGARLLHFLMAEPKLFFERPMTYFDLGEGGFAFYGGVILAAAGILAYFWAARLPVLKLADALAPTVLLGLAIGRIGCFFAGCCHGAPIGLNAESTLIHLQGGEVVTVSGFPWLALIYRRGVGVGDIFDVPIYPTQPWESIGAFLLVFFLSWMWRAHRRFDGQVVGLSLVLYAVLRYTVESFRGDTIRGVDYLGRFSTSQMVSFAMLGLGLVLLAWRVDKGRAPEKPFEDEEILD